MSLLSSSGFETLAQELTYLTETCCTASAEASTWFSRFGAAQNPVTTLQSSRSKTSVCACETRGYECVFACRDVSVIITRTVQSSSVTAPAASVSVSV